MKITLRDEFAKIAFTEFVKNCSFQEGEDVSEAAYRFADMMMSERLKGIEERESFKKSFTTDGGKGWNVGQYTDRHLGGPRAVGEGELPNIIRAARTNIKAYEDLEDQIDKLHEK